MLPRGIPEIRRKLVYIRSLVRPRLLRSFELQILERV